MSIADLFNPSFLMFLGILMIVAALIVVYFESKMREQNHKISSMLSIVSSVAEELNSVRGVINFVGGSHNQSPITSISPSIIELNSSSNIFETKKMDLIEVSDDEDEEDEDEEDEEEEDDEEEDEDEEEDDDDEDNLNIEDLNIDLTNDVNDIKVLKLDIGNNNIEEELVNELEEDIDFDDNESIDFNDAPIKDENNDIKVANFDLKSISIDSTLEEKEPNYKKMSANKLKSIAVEKGLIKASSKLTKQEMLKLFH
jgi:hypothetical protein